jgi:spore coat polysaccharide biosynthesis predicted glycosyltransferase SpsG
MKALFFIDTAEGSGKGHLMRSVEIIKQFKKNGWQVIIIIEKCRLGKLEVEIKALADTLEFFDPNKEININYFIKIARDSNCDRMIIDSYKMNYKNFAKISLDELKVFRILDNPTLQIDGIRDIKLGIRFNLQETNEGLKIIYPIRQLPDKKPKDDKLRNVLFYFGSEPSNQQVELANVVIAKLNPGITGYIYNPNISILNAQNVSFVDTIDEILPNVSLLICAASTIIYEAAYLEIPCITVATNKSQENHDRDLELLGHFINLEENDLRQHEEMVKLIENVISKLEVLEVELGKRRKNLLESSSLHIYNYIVEEFPDLRTNKVKVETTLKSGINFRSITLADSNLILNSRNSPEIRELMVDAQVIPKLSHYNWWFENKRSSFIYELNTNPSVYLWHEQFAENGLDFFIGGWIPLVKNLPPLALFTILDWQIQLTKSINPHAKWLAVINEKNIFTQFANDKLGFKKITVNDPLYRVATKMFKVDELHFSFYKYEFN